MTILMKPIKERKHRLSDACYIGYKIINFTICTNNKKLAFLNKDIVRKFIQILREVKNEYACKILLYVFMPDHLHLLVEGKEKKSNLKKMITSFKQKTGYFLSKNYPDLEWQKDFYDHILRKDDDLIKHIKYILENPVRKNLSVNWKYFSFTGSLDLDLEKIMDGF